MCAWPMHAYFPNAVTSARGLHSPFLISGPICIRIVVTSSEVEGRVMTYPEIVFEGLKKTVPCF